MFDDYVMLKTFDTDTKFQMYYGANQKLRTKG